MPGRYEAITRFLTISSLAATCSRPECLSRYLIAESIIFRSSFEFSNSSVARDAEQPTNFSGFVAVIDSERLHSTVARCCLSAFTDCALVVLRSYQRRVLREIKAKIALA